MDKMIQNRYAEKGTIKMKMPDKMERFLFLPYYGVYSPQKPRKIRVLFECPAEYKGESHNKYLHQQVGSIV